MESEIVEQAHENFGLDSMSRGENVNDETFVDIMNKALDENEGTEDSEDVIHQKEVVKIDITDKILLYGINESPPIHISVVCALQVSTIVFYALYLPVVLYLMCSTCQ